jgi:YggT family protein
MNTIIEILMYLLQLFRFIVFVHLVMSILISFNVINTYNNFVRTVWTGLDRLMDPIYRPIRKVMPDTGGLDLSPMVLLIGIQIAMIVLVNQYQPTFRLL